MMNKLRADNCTAVTALLDPPGPPLTSLLMQVRKPEEVAADPDSTEPHSNGSSDETDPDLVAGPGTPERHTTPDKNSPELAALLSAPVVSHVSPVPPLLEMSLPLEVTPPDISTPLRVLRNRIATVDSLDNNKISSNRKLVPASSSSASPLLGGIRKKVVTMDPACLSRKRPMTRSRHDVASEERNASDTENHVSNIASSNSSSSSTSSSKRSRKSLPPIVTSSSTGSNRILRSNATPQLVVRSLRSQDSFNLRLGQSNPIHLRRKRSRSLTPMKRRK